MNDKVIIIGAGIAGMSAAITLAEQDVKSVIIAPMPSQRAQSVMAEGGINAALDTANEGDSPVLHAEETLSSGRYIASHTAISNMCSSAPELVLDLQRHGMSFTLTSFKEKHIALRSFGGQKKKRTAFADALTGRQLVNTLSAMLRKYEIDGTAELMLGFLFVGLSKDAYGKVNGVFVYCRSTNEIKYVPGKAVIICSGGMNGLFGNCTGSVINTGLTASLLFADGIEMANLEMIQFHPTTLKLPSKNMLVSEAARGEGGRLFVVKDGKPYYFMEDKYPELGNLMPRDVVSREEYALISEGYQIYLDLRHIDPSVIRKRLKSLAEDCKTFLHLDVTCEPIPVEPAIHYFMGGINVDIHHKTSIAGVYAAGECACQYHGANRLGGNSTLGALYGGKVAAQSVIADSGTFSVSDKPSIPPSLPSEPTPFVHAVEQFKLWDMMQHCLGIARNAESIRDGIEFLNALIDKTHNSVDASAFFDNNLGWHSVCMLSLAILKSADARKESRGAHYRSDYPQELPEFAKKTVTFVNDGKIITELRDIEA